MATTGSSSSVSTPDPAPGAVQVVVGVPTGPDWAAGPQEQPLAHADGAPWPGWLTVVARANGASPSAPPLPVTHRDGVLDVTFATVTGDALQTPFHGLPGRGRAVRAIIREVIRTGAAACVVVDPRTTGSRDWLTAMAAPVLGGEAGFVAADCLRHPFAAGLVHGVAAPMAAALYGVRLHHPLAPHFACSAALAADIVDDPFWDRPSAQVALETWLLGAAAERGLGIAEARVPAPMPDPRVRLDLGTTVAQVVGAVFDEMEGRAATWQRIRGWHAVPVVGPPLPPADPPRIDPAGLADAFRQAHRDMEAVWAEVLPPLGILQWRRLAAVPLPEFRVADTLWARTLFDFALGHRLRLMTRDHLLRAFTPLYLAWLASLVDEMADAPGEAITARLDRLCVAAVSEKPYLVSQWRWPERFRPVKLRR